MKAKINIYHSKHFFFLILPVALPVTTTSIYCFACDSQRQVPLCLDSSSRKFWHLLSPKTFHGSETPGCVFCWDPHPCHCLRRSWLPATALDFLECMTECVHPGQGSGAVATVDCSNCQRGNDPFRSRWEELAQPCCLFKNPSPAEKLVIQKTL